MTTDDGERNPIDSADIAWIAVDWGSTNLRAWALGADGKVLATRSAQRGMLRVRPEQYEATLLEEIGDWLSTVPGNHRTEVLICGMAGARQGWIEAAYVPLDRHADVLATLSEHLTSVPVRDQRLQALIVPGICQHPPDVNSRGLDVMRGEETQLAGLVSRCPGVTGAVCLPGTHSKWAHLDAGRIREFTTYMTGELYKVLAHDTVLSHSVGRPVPSVDGLQDADCRVAFLEGVDSAMAEPARFSAELFSIRARDLLDSALTGDDRGRRLDSRLSGLVLGLELSDATILLEAGHTVHLIGDEALSRRYQLALEHRGFHVQCHCSTDMILAGLEFIRHALSTRRSAMSFKESKP